MGCWKVATKQDIWRDIEKQKCLLCRDDGAIRGNEEAGRKFVEVYSGLIWYKVKTRIPESNQKDVVQNIYLKSWASGTPAWCGNPVESFSAYLSKVINAAICNDLRKKIREGKVFVEDVDGLDRAGQPQPHFVGIDVWSLLMTLSEEERTVVWLHYVEDEGHTINEIAGMLGKSVTAIRSTLRRALRKLRKLVR